MPSEWTNPEIPRRRMLSVMLGSACVALRPLMLQAAAPGNRFHFHQTAKAPDASKHLTVGMFNKHQMNTIAALSEIIIPTDSHSAGAKAAHVDEFVNETVAVSTQTVQKLWLDGLAAIDKMAERDCGKTFANCEAAQQVELLRKISQNEDQPVTLEERFFVAVKQSTVEGYYLSDIGIHQELQYQGNAVLSEFPGCTHEEHKAKR
jgi:gluconate 2-dehydrogenase subunit 3-like protein